MQRELFAKTVEELKLHLEQSKNAMVSSYKVKLSHSQLKILILVQELLNNQVPEPLYKFEEILKTMDEELDLAATIFGI